ncbi:nuclear transport factor 2 family protein [Balneola sp. MJW-20]|uniref:nuclear transport factor 2 family protein n=1 Tax=Gracilimonas aurantiaca TaxID=3234185 RepID=UPI0034B4D152
MILSSAQILNAQNRTEEENIRSAIEKMFDGMRDSDSSAVHSVFAQEAILNTIATDESGKTIVRKVDLKSFLNAVGAEKPEIWDERIHQYDIRIDGPLASVFTPYSFYRGEEFSHCGTNSFQMVKVSGEWKIFYLIDTRRQQGCSS